MSRRRHASHPTKADPQAARDAASPVPSSSVPSPPQSLLSVVADRPETDDLLQDPRFQLALKGSGVILFELDRDLRYVWIYNSGLGLRSEDVLGRTDAELVGPENGARLAAPKREALETGQPVQAEVWVEWEGQSTWWELRAEPCRNDAGETVGVLCSALNVTERKWAEEEQRRYREEAERASTAKTGFIRMLGHEMRTPLSAIIGMSELLGGGHGGPVTAEQKRRLDRVRASAWQLLELIDEVLAYARADAEEGAPTWAVVDVAATAADVVDLLSDHAVASDQRLTLLGADAPVHVRTDEGKVRQILTNLVANALAHGGGRTVEVQVTEAEDRVDLTVVDDGRGIPAEELATLFEPYTRGDGARHDGRPGSGLGLAISRRLATVLGGALEVVSRDGQGAAFTLSLPREPAD